MTLLTPNPKTLSPINASRKIIAELGPTEKKVNEVYIRYQVRSFDFCDNLGTSLGQKG